MSESASFLSHLVELRNRLLRAVIAILVVFVVLAPFAAELYDILASPMVKALPEGSKMISTGVIAPFLVPIKVAMMVAFLIALPYVLYQIWAFVAPGLYKHEKQLAVPLTIASTLLFALGMAFCYFFVFGVVFKFVNQIAPKTIAVAPDIESYLNFVLGLFLAFGLTFEVPIVVILLVKMGMVNVAQLREIRPYVIVGAFVLGAIFTPPDVISQLMLAIPLWLLYEVGILISVLIEKSKPPEPNDYQPLSELEMERELDAIEAQERAKTQ